MLNITAKYLDTFRILVAMILLFTSFSASKCFSQEIDCSNFKTGKFFYTPPNGGDVTIKRTNKKQIERYNDENQRFIFKITWKNNCEYTLVLHRTNGVTKKIKKEIIGTTLHCKVLKAELDYYVVTIQSTNSPSTETLTIYEQ